MTMTLQDLMTKITKNPLLKVISVIIVLLVLLGGVYNGIEAALKIYSQTIGVYFDNTERNLIKKLHTDMSDEYFNEILGKPLAKRNLDGVYNSDESKMYRQDIYRTNHCIIKTVVNAKESIVEYYAVLVMSKYYKIEFPSGPGEKPLFVGKTYLSEISNGLEDYWCNGSSKFNIYTETPFPASTASGYKTFLVGYNSLGHDFMNEKEIHSYLEYTEKIWSFDNEPRKRENLKVLFDSIEREKIIPNCFAVVSMAVSDEILDVFEHSEIGIDWLELLALES
ncbi:hypothetical protein FACS1894109_04020 [Spirochaetia bacterium]|nr:hypothetical protein FACS1894109_04020 [Spirochaetia bacterium]